MENKDGTVKELILKTIRDMGEQYENTEYSSSDFVPQLVEKLTVLFEPKHADIKSQIAYESHSQAIEDACEMYRALRDLPVNTSYASAYALGRVEAFKEFCARHLLDSKLVVKVVKEEDGENKE